MNQAIALAMTGASGADYGLRLLECLVKANKRVYLMLSGPGQVVISMETNLSVPSKVADIQAYFTELYDAKDGQIRVFGKEQWTAPVASGSGAPEAMVVCPCTSGTLAAIAAGASRCLIERAADVVIKERKRLILVPREMPFSSIHLEHMLKLSNMGVTIMPASPGFYQRPQKVMDLVDFVVARILDHLAVKQDLLPRWGAD